MGNISHVRMFDMYLVLVKTIRSPLSWNIYGKCPKISYTNITNKMAYANSPDPDQIVPKGVV